MSRIRKLAAMGGVCVLMALNGAASAQEAPTLVGTWKGMAMVVHIGSNPYRVAESNGPNLPPNAVEMTYVITKQEGNRFAGTSSNGKFTETVIGAISPDSRTGIALDDDGQYTFTLRDLNTIDLCYAHSFPTSKVVGCWQIKRAAN